MRHCVFCNKGLFVYLLPIKSRLRLKQNVNLVFAHDLKKSGNYYQTYIDKVGKMKKKRKNWHDILLKELGSIFDL